MCQTNIFANFSPRKREREGGREPPPPYFSRHVDIKGAKTGAVGCRMKELLRHQSGWVITFLAAVRNDWQSKLVSPRAGDRESRRRRRRRRQCTRSSLHETSSLTVFHLPFFLSPLLLLSLFPLFLPAFFPSTFPRRHSSPTPSIRRTKLVE